MKKFIFTIIASMAMLIPSMALAATRSGALISNPAFDGRGPATGYRGFVDIGYVLGTGQWGVDRMELNTTHGYQVCPFFFAGAGVGLNYFSDGDCVSVPLYADFRFDILDNSISPFLDFKLGYTVADLEGFYFHPSVGLRFDVKNLIGINVGVGYTIQKFDTWWGTENCGGVSFKVGIDF